MFFVSVKEHTSRLILTQFIFCPQDVFIECEDSYGPIDEMNVCDNLGDHLVGNVYIKVGCGRRG